MGLNLDSVIREQMDFLWENPDSRAPITSTEYSVPAIKNYDALLVCYFIDNNNETNMSTILLKGADTTKSFITFVSSGLVANRMLTFVFSTGQVSVASCDGTTRTDVLIPWKIFGIKL